ncbi:MAG: class I SAM-dependent methyltransferase [Candidatus Paceibacterota bacterium]|jgi:ubiquinone/menaquinone biosynthesis C-methylase UbiE
MDYQEHKKHFNAAYKTGTDAWTHPYTDRESLKLTEKLSPNAYILDIGSGRGFLAKHLAEMGFKVIGIDFDGDIVNKANGDIMDWKLEGRVKFVEADALSIPFPDASFDAACDFGLFETLYKNDWEKYASEVNRVLKPGGFYFNVSLSAETGHFFEFSPKGSTEKDFEKYGIHYHFFEKAEMKSVFSGKLETISQGTSLATKNDGVVLLETLFQKNK